MDGPGLPVPGAHGRLHRARTRRRPAPRDVRVRRHLRHQQRVGLRLPARQHEDERRRNGAARALFLDRGRGGLDPGRRSAHAADHLRSAGRPGGALQRARRRDAAPEARAFRARRETEAGVLHGSRQRVHGAGAGRARPAQAGYVVLRYRERDGRAPRDAGAQGTQTVPARPRLHREERAGRHHRRVHRPHDAGPALLGRPAPGTRGEGARRDPAREPDAGLDHLPELLPPLRKARGHDRHGRDRSQRVHGHLRPRRDRGADQRHGRAHRRARRGLPHGRREEPRHRRRNRRCPPPRPAGPRRHDVDRKVRATVGTAQGPQVFPRDGAVLPRAGRQPKARQGRRAENAPD